MSPQFEYYQIGGFRAQTNAWYGFDHNLLAGAIAQKDSPLRSPHSGGIKLILGVLPTGATYMLITANQMIALARVLRLRVLTKPWLLSDFESLSPIYFPDEESLAKKLATYKAKYKKGKSTLQDNSQANRNYVLDGQASGIARGAFEHGRVFYRILKDDIDLHSIGLLEPPWRKSIPIYSLICNTWSKDTRPLQERLHKPLVMDIGWTELDVSTLRPKTEVGSSSHFIPANNRRLGQGMAKADFAHGESEIVDSETLSSRLREFLPTSRHSTSKPLVLLVFGDEPTRFALQTFGIDTSSWKSGIKSLLGFPDHKRNAPVSSDRKRSRSPHQDLGYHQNSSRRHERISPPNHHERKIYAPVHIIDVREMYSHITPTQDASFSDTVNELFGSDLTEWCAGNECHLLAHAWQYMVEGPSIDEQRKMRLPAAPVTQQVVNDMEPEYDDDDDDEGDYDDGEDDDDDDD